MNTRSLADTVRTSCTALREAGASDPQVLLLLGTGAGTLTGSLGSHREIPLARIESLPDPWHSSVLHTGTLAGARVWMVDDQAGDPLSQKQPPPPAWVRPLPCWLAAASGATLCIHTSAGITLRDGEEPKGLDVGSIALARDHINLSGHTPLVGIGENALGPLFPDQTHLHHAGLRERVLDRARELGIRAGEAVVACTLGPNLSTPAELSWYEAVGADVAVQDLAPPLIAGAHAGLAMLSLVALTDGGRERLRLREIVARTEACAPALEDLLLACAPDFATVARELEEEA